jgi:hypothetical protein
VHAAEMVENEKIRRGWRQQRLVESARSWSGGRDAAETQAPFLPASIRGSCTRTLTYADVC